MPRRARLLLISVLILSSCSRNLSVGTTITLPAPPEHLTQVVESEEFTSTVSEVLLPRVEVADTPADPYTPSDVPAERASHFDPPEGPIRFEEGASAAGEVVAILATRLDEWFALVAQDFEPFGGVEMLVEPTREPVAIDTNTFVLDGRWRGSGWQFWRGDIWGLHVRPSNEGVEVVDYILSGWPTDAYAYRVSELVGDPDAAAVTLNGALAGYVEALWLSPPWDSPGFLEEMSVEAGEWRMYAFYCVTEPWLEINPDSLYSEVRGWDNALAATYGVGVWTPACYLLAVHHLTEADLERDAVIEIPVGGESVDGSAMIELHVPAFGVPENVCAFGENEGTLLCPSWSGSGSIDANPDWKPRVSS